MEVSGEFHAAAASPFWGGGGGVENHFYPLNRRLGGPQNQSQGYREEKISCPCQESNPETPSPWLSYIFVDSTSSIEHCKLTVGLHIT
jgi:hypothetical protein